MIEFEIKKSRPKNIDLTSMVDVVFLLLIFFLLTSIFPPPGLQIELPTSKTGQYSNETGISLIIMDTGLVRMQDESIPLEKLLSQLKQELSLKSTQLVTLTADQDTPLKRVIEVMDISRLAGATQLSIQVEKVE